LKLMASKFGRTATNRIVAFVLLPPFTYVAAAQVYIDYRVKWGTKRRYPESPLYLESNSKDLLAKISEKRKKLLECLQKSLEVADDDDRPLTRAVKNDIYTEDVVWRDPLMTIKGREDLTRVLTMLPRYILKCETTEFEPVHYNDYVRVSYARRLVFANKANYDRESSLIVKLRTESEETSGEEKIYELTDEWNSVPLVDRTNSTLFGHFSELLRVYFTKFELLKESFRNRKSQNHSENAENQAILLETPSPKHAVPVKR